MSGVHAWIAANSLQLLGGIHEYQCPVQGAPDLALTVKCTQYRSGVPGESFHRIQIFDEIDRQWIVETVGYKQGGYVGFELYEGDDLMAGMSLEALQPVCSPDGQWIYFGSSRSVNREIWHTPARGGEALQVTRHGGAGQALTVDLLAVLPSRQASTRLSIQACSNPR